MSSCKQADPQDVPLIFPRAFGARAISSDGLQQRPQKPRSQLSMNCRCGLRVRTPAVSGPMGREDGMAAWRSRSRRS